MEILIGLVLLGATLAVAFVLPILSYWRASQASRRADALAHEVQALRAEVAALRADDLGPMPPSAQPPVAQAAPTRWTDSVEDRHHQTTPAAPAAAAPVTSSAPAVAAASPPAAATVGLEARIGARWLLYAGLGALILGASYFIKFAFDNGWVSEPLRVAVGLAAGGALVAVGQRFVARGLGFFGHALSGGGLVVLYIAVHAARHAYDLIAPATALIAMIGVTALGAWLAERHRAQVLGALAILGGFIAPALAGRGDDRQVFLFLYDTLLLVAALSMLVRHAWAAVAVLASVLAAVMSVAWVAAHYDPGAGPRTLLLLTLHLAVVAAMIVALRRQRTRAPQAAAAARLLLSAPVLYHVAALWLIGRSQGLLLVYLLLASVAGLSAAYHAGWRWARTLVLLLVALPFINWIGGPITPRWYAAGLVTAVALYLLHLAGQWRDLSDDDPGLPVPVAELVHTHATGVFLPLALYAFLAEHAAWWNAPMLTAVALWNLAIAALLRMRRPVLSWQFVALAAASGAVAISEWFAGPLVAIGWAVEGAALGHAALRSRSPWLQAGALGLLLLGASRLVDALTQAMPVGTWPVINVRAFAALMVVGAMTWLAARHRAASDHPGDTWTRHILILGAHVLTIGWLSAEIALLFGERAYAASAAGLPAGVARAVLAEQVALSVAWALYAVGLVAAGFRHGYAPARYLAIALFALTILKVLTKDIAELDRVPRMLSVLGLGALLVAASYLYQRMAAPRLGSESTPP